MKPQFLHITECILQELDGPIQKNEAKMKGSFGTVFIHGFLPTINKFPSVY